MHKANCWSC